MLDSAASPFSIWVSQGWEIENSGFPSLSAICLLRNSTSRVLIPSLSRICLSCSPGPMIWTLLTLIIERGQMRIRVRYPIQRFLLRHVGPPTQLSYLTSFDARRTKDALHRRDAPNERNPLVVKLSSCGERTTFMV